MPYNKAQVKVRKLTDLSKCLFIWSFVHLFQFNLSTRLLSNDFRASDFNSHKLVYLDDNFQKSHLFLLSVLEQGESHIKLILDLKILFFKSSGLWGLTTSALTAFLMGSDFGLLTGLKLYIFNSGVFSSAIGCKVNFH